MGIVVHRINAPRVARAVMGYAENAIHDGVAHEHVAGGHIDFGTEDVGPIPELTGPHARKQIEVFLDRALAIGALPARSRRCAAVGTDFLSAQAVNVRLAGLDELHSV